MSINPSVSIQVKNLIDQIVFLITSKKDYQGAANLMIQNNLDLSTLISYTYKLRDKDLAILTDKILLSK